MSTVKPPAAVTFSDPIPDEVKPPPRGPGRPAHEPKPEDRRYVEAMSAMGLPAWQIARIVGITEPTLRKHYAEEIELGPWRANLEVAQSLFRQATRKDKPSLVAQIFWLKARAGWIEAGKDMDAPGKKAVAEALSKTADHGTPWEDLLSPRERVQ